MYQKLKWLPPCHCHKGGKHTVGQCFNMENEVKESKYRGSSQTFSSLAVNSAITCSFRQSEAQGDSKNTYCMSGKRAERERDRFAHISLWPLRGGSCLWFVI